MTACISEALREEVLESAREKYPSAFKNIKDMYREQAERLGRTVTEKQLHNIAERILGKCP